MRRGLALAGARTLHVAFDTELPGEFVRAFCGGLDALQIAHADINVVQTDHENPAAIDIYVVSASRGGTGARDSTNTIVIIGGPGEREHSGRALRVEARDIAEGSRRWAAAAGRVGERTGRPGLDAFVLAASAAERQAWSLDHPSDPLATDLAEAGKPDVLARQLVAVSARADKAEAALRLMERDANVNAIDIRRAESTAAASHMRIAELEAENARLRAHLESAAFALSLVPAGARETVERARDAAGRAQLAAADALRMADRHAGALVWPKGDAAYAGETKNRHPHGGGAMTFARTGSFYRGDFVEGRREGFGVGRADDGTVWSGQWANSEACGFGILETADGRRFEGEVRPGDNGPRRVSGHVWGTGANAAKGEPIPLRPQIAARLLPAG